MTALSAPPQLHAEAAMHCHDEGVCPDFMHTACNSMYFYCYLYIRVYVILTASVYIHNGVNGHNTS